MSFDQTKTSVCVMPKPENVTRILQRAGRHKPLSYRDGFALRLPRNKLLLVIWRDRKQSKDKLGGS